MPVGRRPREDDGSGRKEVRFQRGQGDRFPGGGVPKSEGGSHAREPAAIRTPGGRMARRQWKAPAHRSFVDVEDDEAGIIESMCRDECAVGRKSGLLAKHRSVTKEFCPGGVLVS